MAAVDVTARGRDGYRRAAEVCRQRRGGAPAGERVQRVRADVVAEAPRAGWFGLAAHVAGVASRGCVGIRGYFTGRRRRPAGLAGPRRAMTVLARCGRADGRAIRVDAALVRLRRRLRIGRGGAAAGGQKRVQSTDQRRRARNCCTKDQGRVVRRAWLDHLEEVPGRGRSSAAEGLIPGAIDRAWPARLFLVHHQYVAVVGPGHGEGSTRQQPFDPRGEAERTPRDEAQREHVDENVSSISDGSGPEVS